MSQADIDVLGGVGLDSTPATAGNALQLREYALKVLDEWRRPSVWETGAQLRAATLQNARDYAGRYVFELIQNGHDAHDGGRHDGRVALVLDEDEGEHGVLYAANAGEPFTWRRVMAICKLARSEKAIGDGIGNKGVGFRSVLHITRRPEVYSAAPGSPGSGRLDGYCFRFADRADLEELLGDPALAERADRELPHFQVPVPIRTVPATAAQLAKSGYVSVIRLPLMNERARAETATLLAELTSATVPLMLFLRRLAYLTIEHRADGTLKRAGLGRAETQVALPSATEDQAPGLPRTSVARVDLGGSGRFTVIRGSVPSARLAAVVEDAVADGRLDEVWAEWTEPAEVELAIPESPQSRPGRLYVFLPLGEQATAPCAGHLNAPFFTKVDRTALDATHPLNSALLDIAAEASLNAAAEMRRHTPEAGGNARRWAAELVAWAPSSIARLSEASRRVHAMDLKDVAFVPVLPAAHTGQTPGAAAWAQPLDSLRWPRGDFAILTAAAAAESGLRIVDPGLPAATLDRLTKLCTAMGRPLQASPSTLADAVEEMLGSLPRPPATDAISIWDSAYDDIATIFDDVGDELVGRRILLGDDGATCTTRMAMTPPANPGDAPFSRRARSPRSA